ncbi:hypothetical protein DEHRE_03230 [Dehalobacter restrictus DSM 9455]|uniref:Uncharacterized protein n=1 Tax=Dehalobacter restrictus (strain DSM 9455 / PER-K23) TaxID=871738 RepID=A0ABN4BW27_DEHRP|nr:hypothetical protein DEHRE_03230 [Dehalobacter restrictus DSM 9455]
MQGGVFIHEAPLFYGPGKPSDKPRGFGGSNVVNLRTYITLFPLNLGCLMQGKLEG